MAEPGDILSPDDDVPAKKIPWGPIVIVIAIIAAGILIFLITREKRNEQQRQAILSALDQELGSQEALVNAQREKVMQLTRQLETLRTSIQVGQTRNTKAAIAEYNQLAAQQRAERDKFRSMADEYNKKVAKFKEIQQ